jgi:hypothetical protein
VLGVMFRRQSVVHMTGMCRVSLSRAAYLPRRAQALFGYSLSSIKASSTRILQGEQTESRENEERGAEL